MSAATQGVSASTRLSANIINLFLGIWVLISPLILGFTTNRGAVCNDAIVGTAIMVVAVEHASAGLTQASRIGWINYVLGIWLIISPFVLVCRQRPEVFWNQVIVGIVVAVSALTACGLTAEPRSAHYTK